jgi:signal transduction histidine kinase
MSVDWQELILHIAHDSRALIRKGLSNAQLLQRRLGPAIEAEAAENLTAILESQLDLNRLFVRLVALADAERPPRSAHSKQEMTDLETVVLGAKIECGQAIQQAGAELIIEELPAASVPQKTQIVLRELIDNSLRYRDPSRTPRVVIGAEGDENTVRVRVADNGAGVTSMYADKLFQPLQRLDAVRSGFGLGLAISRAILLTAGGSIEFEPSDAGASFVFQLPAKAQ